MEVEEKKKNEVIKKADKHKLVGEKRILHKPNEKTLS